MKKILPLIASFLIAAAALGGYAYMTITVKNSVDRRASAMEETDSLTKKDNALQAAGAALRDTQALSDALAAFVSSPTDVVRGIELLEAAGRGSGARLELGTVTITEPQAWTHHEAVAITFSAEGTFLQLVKLLNTVEGLPHLVRLENASLRKPDKEAWTVSASVVFVKEKP